MCSLQPYSGWVGGLVCVFVDRFVRFCYTYPCHVSTTFLPGGRQQLVLEAFGSRFQVCFFFPLSQNEPYQAPRDIGTAWLANVPSSEVGGRSFSSASAH